MAMLKKNLTLVIFIVVCVVGLGMSFWGISAGAAVEEKVRAVDQLASTVRTSASGAKNPEAIEKTLQFSKARNEEIEQTLNDALGPQVNNTLTGGPRSLLIPGILPEPKSDAARIDFRGKYNEAFSDMLERLHARGRATVDEIAKEVALDVAQSDDLGVEVEHPWRPVSASESGALLPRASSDDPTRVDVLRDNAESRVAERIAKSIYMYVDDGAIGPHDVARSKGLLSTESIWQAHMTLWIAQDFAAAFAGLNDSRAAGLESSGRGNDAWVANMPVKNWVLLSIDGRLGGGVGLNDLDSVKDPAVYGTSFTDEKNDAEHFVVPIRLELVVEEASAMDVIGSICGAGYYAPRRIRYESVPQNPLQERYIYGDAPVVKMIVDLEGYYFRPVYEEWIPKDLKKALATPGAFEERRPGRG